MYAAIALQGRIVRRLRSRILGWESRSSSLTHILIACIVAGILVVTISQNLLLEDAEAVTWPLSASRPVPSLPYGAMYEFGEADYRHSGIDMSAKAGTSVRAPVAGTVSFVGDVPAGESCQDGESRGHTMRAVSLRIDGGYTLTLMPFDSVYVQPGDKVGEEEAIGMLASSGDRSSSMPHLHMGLKQGDVYRDPMSLFDGLSNPASSSASDVRSAVDMKQAAETTAPILEKAYAPAVTPEEVLPRAGSVTSGVVNWNSSAVTSPTLLEEVESWVLNGFEACAAQAMALRMALVTFSINSGIPLLIIMLGFTAFCVIAFTASVLMISCWVIPAVGHLWINYVRPLREFGKGTTLLRSRLKRQKFFLSQRGDGW